MAKESNKHLEEYKKNLKARKPIKDAKAKQVEKKLKKMPSLKKGISRLT